MGVVAAVERLVVARIAILVGVIFLILTYLVSGITVDQEPLSGPWRLDPGIYQFTTLGFHEKSCIIIEFVSDHPVNFYIKNVYSGVTLFSEYRTTRFKETWIVPSSGHYHIWVDNTHGEVTASGHIKMIERRPMIDPQIINYAYIITSIILIIGIGLTLTKKYR